MTTPLTGRLHTGKELRTFNGLYHYDNHARIYDPLTGRFTTIDPLAGKYPSLTPYNHCANNPLILIDPDGQDIWRINNQGTIISTEESTQVDKFIMVDNKDNVLKDKNGKELSISFKYGTVISQKTYDYKLKEENEIRQYDVYKVRGDDSAKDLFEFMSNNITGSKSMVEVSLTQTGVSGERGLNFIATGHYRGSEPGLKYLWDGQIQFKYTIRSMIHSHPLDINPGNNDKTLPGLVKEHFDKNGWKMALPTFKIYHVPTKTYISF